MQNKIMKHLKSTQTEKNFSTVVDEVVKDKERVILTQKGKDLIALVPVEDAQLLEDLEDRHDLEDARKTLKEEGAISWGKVKTDLRL